MDAQTLAEPDRAVDSSALPVLITTVISNIAVRVIIHAGKPWVVLKDVVSLLGYKKPRKSDIALIFKSHRKDLDDFTLTLPFGRRGLSIINEAGLFLMCDFIKQHRSTVLARWLKDGGCSSVLAQLGEEQKDGAVLRTTLRDNAPGKNRVDAAFLEEQKRRLAAKDSLIGQSKCAVDGAFAAPSSPLPPTGKPVTENHLADDEADYPAVYILLPGDYNGWPISLVRHEGKVWLITHEVAAVLSRDGGELADIQAMFADWHANGHPALLKIRLGGTPTPVLVIDASAVAVAEGLDSPESAAFAAWCAGLNTAPALAEVKALHEEPADENPAERMAQIYDWHQRANRQLLDVVSQIRGVHELAELSAGGDSKFSVGDLGGMLKVARRLVEETEEMFTGVELDMLRLRKYLAKQEEVLH